MVKDDLEARATTISPVEAGRRLGVTHETLANWRVIGRGPRYLKIGGRVRYRLADLADWIDGQVRGSSPSAPDAPAQSRARTKCFSQGNGGAE